jgi:hypothetical protein
MGRVWVLDTETKGTGANMVPLERVTKRSSEARPVVVPRKPRPPRREAPEPPAPRVFRIVDVMSRRLLADEASTREAVGVLRKVRSIVDADIYVWEPERERWRMLKAPERHAIWELAGHQPAPE